MRKKKKKKKQANWKKIEEELKAVVRNDPAPNLRFLHKKNVRLNTVIGKLHNINEIYNMCI